MELRVVVETKIRSSLGEPRSPAWRSQCVYSNKAARSNNSSQRRPRAASSLSVGSQRFRGSSSGSSAAGFCTAPSAGHCSASQEPCRSSAWLQLQEFEQSSKYKFFPRIWLSPPLFLLCLSFLSIHSSWLRSKYEQITSLAGVSLQAIRKLKLQRPIRLDGRGRTQAALALWDEVCMTTLSSMRNKKSVRGTVLTIMTINTVKIRPLA